MGCDSYLGTLQKNEITAVTVKVHFEGTQF